MWDGFQGTLHATPRRQRVPDRGTDQLRGAGHLLHQPQDVVAGYQGPGNRGANVTNAHRVVFWIDLANTPGNGADDQRFDGYFFTATLNGMAGVTWWANIPFGFYARFESNVLG